MSNKIKSPVVVGAIILIIILTGAFFIFKNAPVSSISETRILMDTEFTITLYGSDLEEAKEDAFNTILQLEMLSDPYMSYDEVEYNLYQLNNDPSSDMITLDKDLYTQLKRGVAYYEPTNGEYNIGIFHLINLWKTCEEENRLPTKEEISAILNNSNLSEVVFDDDTTSIKRSPEIQFDLGSLAKGYAIEKVYETLKKYDNVTGAVINGGGNIKVLGEKTSDDDTYKIGLQDPEDMSNLLGTITLKDGEAVSTSGSYQRYYSIDGVQYSHILSGISGFPPTYFNSVTVLTEDGGESDMLSTILYLLPLDEGKKFLSTLDFKVEALWIDTDNVIHKTDDFPIIMADNEGYTYEE